MSALRKLLVAIVVSLFAASLALNLSALYQAGAAAKVSIPPAFPWVLDGFTVAMTLVIVEAKRERRALTVWPPGRAIRRDRRVRGRAGRLRPRGPWDKLLHTLAPVAVLWSFETLTWLVFGPRPAAAELAPVEAPDEPEEAGGRHLARPEVHPEVRREVGPEVREVVTERRSIEATRTTTRTAQPNRTAQPGSKAERIRELAAAGHDLDAIVAETGFPRDTVRVTLRRAKSTEGAQGAEGGEGR